MNQPAKSDKHLLRRFPTDPLAPAVQKIRGSYVYLEDGTRLLDLTSGYSACVALGGNRKEVQRAMIRQLKRFPYVSALSWSNPNAEELAELLTRNAPAGLDRVMLPGCSGSEAIEAAMRMSYQLRAERGQHDKCHFISRFNAYHGITSLALSISSTDVYEFLRPLQPQISHLIAQHNYYEKSFPGESEAEYAARSAGELEAEIIRVGPERITAFVAETMLGQLQGNVPPSVDYWKRIREICNRYDIHLILDEVYCGLGRSGKVYCCSWDDIAPDFVATGKQLAAGYAPISAVITKSEFEEEIKRGKKRIFFASTYEAHPVAVAAAVAVQKIAQSEDLLSHVRRTGEAMRLKLSTALGQHPFFRSVRGRGMLSTIEYDCENRDGFNLELEAAMRARGYLMQARYHRANFNPPSTTSERDLLGAIEAFIEVFDRASSKYRDKVIRK
ncbi:MAG: aspartate aminotransferase family protein [Actinomycetota bacterium]